MKPALTLCALLSIAAVARANDTAAGGSGTDIVPLETADIRMAAEDILIVHRGIDWVIEAEYTFENLTDKPIKLQVAFPEYACEGGDPRTDPDVMCDSKPLRYQSMRTTVNGADVSLRNGTIKAGHPWKPRLGQVWLFDATFEPGKQTRIHHSYSVHETEDSGGGRAITYVTRTGATWAGKIGHARFRFLIPFDAYEVYPPEGSGLELTQRATEVDGRLVGEVTLEGREWEPEVDLHFYFNASPGRGLLEASSVGEGRTRGDTPDPHCPQLNTIWSRGGEIGEPNPGDAIDLTDSVDHWADKLAPEWRGDFTYCRAYIFAYRGKDLRDDALNKYFYGPEGHKDRGWPYLAYEPNAYYRDSLLTKGDLTTLLLFDAIEARVNAKVVTKPSAPAAAAPPKPVGGGCSVFAPGARAD